MSDRGLMSVAPASPIPPSPRTVPDFVGNEVGGWALEPQKEAPRTSHFWGSEGPSFKDLLDTINPLQHLPIIGPIYRSITGDQPSHGARILGGALFGGHVMAARRLDRNTPASTGGEPATQVAAAVAPSAAPVQLAAATALSALRLPASSGPARLAHPTNAPNLYAFALPPQAGAAKAAVRTARGNGR
ncbi:MAG: hypothetical protein EXQ85_10255 [Alphaproteobacteria bacterium]|nr:hypothetical protein [Alphaproteobacteria bacterium]